MPDIKNEKSTSPKVSKPKSWPHDVAIRPREMAQIRAQGPAQLMEYWQRLTASIKVPARLIALFRPTAGASDTWTASGYAGDSLPALAEQGPPEVVLRPGDGGLGLVQVSPARAWDWADWILGRQELTPLERHVLASQLGVSEPPMVPAGLSPLFNEDGGEVVAGLWRRVRQLHPWEPEKPSRLVLSFEDNGSRKLVNVRLDALEKGVPVPPPTSARSTQMIWQLKGRLGYVVQDDADPPVDDRSPEASPITHPAERVVSVPQPRLQPEPETQPEPQFQPESPLPEPKPITPKVAPPPRLRAREEARPTSEVLNGRRWATYLVSRSSQERLPLDELKAALGTGVAIGTWSRSSWRMAAEQKSRYYLVGLLTAKDQVEDLQLLDMVGYIQWRREPDHAELAKFFRIEFIRTPDGRLRKGMTTGAHVDRILADMPSVGEMERWEDVRKDQGGGNVGQGPRTEKPLSPWPLGPHQASPPPGVASAVQEFWRVVHQWPVTYLVGKRTKDNSGNLLMLKVFSKSDHTDWVKENGSTKGYFRLRFVGDGGGSIRINWGSGPGVLDMAIRFHGLDPKELSPVLRVLFAAQCNIKYPSVVLYLSDLVSDLEGGAVIAEWSRQLGKRGADTASRFFLLGRVDPFNRIEGLRLLDKKEYAQWQKTEPREETDSHFQVEFVRNPAGEFKVGEVRGANAYKVGQAIQSGKIPEGGIDFAPDADAMDRARQVLAPKQKGYSDVAPVRIEPMVTPETVLIPGSNKTPGYDAEEMPQRLEAIFPEVPEELWQQLQTPPSVGRLHDPVQLARMREEIAEAVRFASAVTGTLQVMRDSAGLVGAGLQSATSFLGTATAIGATLFVPALKFVVLSEGGGTTHFFCGTRCGERL